MTDLVLILEHEQCYSCEYWTSADELGSFCINQKVKTKNLLGDCQSYKEADEKK